MPCSTHGNPARREPGSPPPAALKKLVARCRSINIIVTAAAKTGMMPINKKAVTSQLQQKIGIFIIFMPGVLRLSRVTIILMAPIKEERPIKCTARIK